MKVRTLFFLVLFVPFLAAGCASTPERLDGAPFDQTQYETDQADCRAEVLKIYPELRTRRSLGIIAAPTGQIESAYLNCMRKRGWKNF